MRRSLADARCHPEITLPHSSSVGASMGVMSRVGRSGVWTTSNPLSVFSSLLFLSRPRSRSFCERLGVRRVAPVGCIAMTSPENGSREWGWFCWRAVLPGCIVCWGMWQYRHFLIRIKDRAIKRVLCIRDVPSSLSFMRPAARFREFHCGQQAPFFVSNRLVFVNQTMA
jgi:hypothetical protein